MFQEGTCDPFGPSVRFGRKMEPRGLAAWGRWESIPPPPRTFDLPGRVRSSVSDAKVVEGPTGR